MMFQHEGIANRSVCWHQGRVRLLVFPRVPVRMTALQTFCQWLYDLPASEALRESDDVFPVIETIHVLGICLMVGTIAAVDLRLTGALLRGYPAARISRALLPYTWAGFALMFVTG